MTERLRKALRKEFVEASSSGLDNVMQRILGTVVEHSGNNYSSPSFMISQALGRAALNNHESVVETILETGRELNLERPHSKRLREALPKGTEEIKLLDTPEINKYREIKGNALVNTACKHDGIEVLRILAEGADMNFTVELIYNALSAAALDGRLSMIHLLLDNGADPNAKYGRRTMTALKTIVARYT